MIRCIFHIDLDAFFVSVERALNPELEGKPVIVGGDPERRGVVASASYEARASGIHAGMPLSRAGRLCPQAIFIRANFPRYKETSAKFMKILADFSSHIEPLGIDEAYLDVTGCEELYGTPQKLALAIKERIRKELKLTASIGIGTCKVVAKIASDLCKPDGLLQVPPGQEQSFLHPLPVSKLPGVGKKTEQKLKEMGVSTVGELASLPLDMVKAHLGQVGAVIHSYARGVDNREVEAPGEAKSLSQQLTFSRDTRDRTFLKATLRHLCRHVCQQLRSRNKCTRCIAIRLRYADFKTITRQFSLRQASDSDPVIFAVAIELLNKALKERETAIRLTGIRLSSLANKETRFFLFDSETEGRERLDKVIEEIKKRYGRQAINWGDVFLASGLINLSR